MQIYTFIPIKDFSAYAVATTTAKSATKHRLRHVTLTKWNSRCIFFLRRYSDYYFEIFEYITNENEI